jgi:hypothetical protein
MKVEETVTGKGMGRRQFIGTAAAALFAGVSISLVGCSEDDPAGPADGDKAAFVGDSGGHKHTAVITKAQLETNGTVTVTLTGSGHEHSVEFSATEVAAIKAGTHVMKNCTLTSNHVHSVMFN